MTRRFWTEEETRRLAMLTARRMTAGQIGIKLKRPRNSVIGKVHRAKGDLGQLGGKNRPIGRPQALPAASRQATA